MTVKCFCNLEFLNHYDLAEHCLAEHRSEYVPSVYLNQLELSPHDIVVCWCDGNFSREDFVKHLSEIGNLAAHILEHALGVSE